MKNFKIQNAIVIICFLVGVNAFGQTYQEVPGRFPTRNIAEEIRDHHSGLAVWWTGHNGWLIKSGDTLVSTDLVLETEEDRLYDPPVSAAEIAADLDIAFITHEHGDHFSRATSRILLEKSDCIFVMPETCLEAARELGIPEIRIRIATPRDSFKVKGVKVKALRAIHGNPKFAVFYNANLQDCGYLITLGGKDFLQPGDTVLLEDHLFLKHVDVLFFSPTEHNMHIQQSVLLINELAPDYILPQHRNTFRVTDQNRYWTTAYAHEVKMYLSKPLRKNRYHILNHGEKLEIR
ncbi:MAG: MBL fold metallo-hydrolase [Candidatus Marinimicrobia bacterium]|nr:MBL fold metallo-hydrolase [Candidatus Neomarinimicrobiota bacterium]MCF7830205.1 MBL fold metallo-hydrolase [Candidatus Neomarinimicrobiota bacterium]MCF7880822.1 MBL fold metallo-hydrolase [Candidatus Neomarinimicrobiota bacterium]